MINRPPPPRHPVAPAPAPDDRQPGTVLASSLPRRPPPPRVRAPAPDPLLATVRARPAPPPRPGSPPPEPFAVVSPYIEPPERASGAANIGGNPSQKTTETRQAPPPRSPVQISEFSRPRGHRVRQPVEPEPPKERPTLPPRTRVTVANPISNDIPW